MKRKLIIITIIIILLILSYNMFFSREISPFTLQEIHIQSLEPNSKVFTITKNEKADFKNFINLINKSDKNLTSDQTVEYNHQIVYQTKRKHLKYFVNVDTVEQKITLLNEKKNNSYFLTHESTKGFLLHPAFSSAYKYHAPPSINLTEGNNSINMSNIEYNWNYKKINGDWYKNEDSIVNSSSSPLNIVNHDQIINIDFDIEPKSLKYYIYDEENLIYENSLFNEGIHPYTEDGVKTYIIEANWPQSNAYDFYGTALYSFKVNTDLPATLTFSNSSVEIGDVFKIKVNNLNKNEKPIVSQKILGSFQFYVVDDISIGYLPVSYHTKADTYQLDFWTEGENKVISKPIKYTLNVTNRDFKIQQLTISKTIAKSTRNDKAYSEFAKYFNPARETSVSEKLWDGPFIKPVDGRTSTTYGERRYVNDAPTSYRHSGMDIAISRGTPIKATNNGKVNLAKKLILTGNTIVIDHGLGFFSVYFHCDTLNVEEGQTLSKSDIIGTVGSTGFSTGPHLHWTMSIFDQNINPELVIGNQF